MSRVLLLVLTFLWLGCIQDAKVEKVLSVERDTIYITDSTVGKPIVSVVMRYQVVPVDSHPLYQVALYINNVYSKTLTVGIYDTFLVFRGSNFSFETYADFNRGHVISVVDTLIMVKSKFIFQQDYTNFYDPTSSFIPF